MCEPLRRDDKERTNASLMFALLQLERHTAQLLYLIMPICEGCKVSYPRLKLRLCGLCLTSIEDGTNGHNAQDSRIKHRKVSAYRMLGDSRTDAHFFQRTRSINIDDESCPDSTRKRRRGIFSKTGSGLSTEVSEYVPVPSTQRKIRDRKAPPGMQFEETERMMLKGTQTHHADSHGSQRLRMMLSTCALYCGTFKEVSYVSADTSLD